MSARLGVAGRLDSAQRGKHSLGGLMARRMLGGLRQVDSLRPRSSSDIVGASK